VFRAVGIPIEDYDLAYALLGKAQDEARAARQARSPQVAQHLEPAPASVAVEDNRPFARPPLVQAWRHTLRPGWPPLPAREAGPARPSRVRVTPGIGARVRPTSSPSWPGAGVLVAGARPHGPVLPDIAAAPLITDDLPAAVLVALVVTEQLTGEEIAELMGG